MLCACVAANPVGRGLLGASAAAIRHSAVLVSSVLTLISLLTSTLSCSGGRPVHDAAQVLADRRGGTVGCREAAGLAGICPAHHRGLFLPCLLPLGMPVLLHEVRHMAVGTSPAVIATSQQVARPAHLVAAARGRRHGEVSTAGCRMPEQLLLSQLWHPPCFLRRLRLSASLRSSSGRRSAAACAPRAAIGLSDHGTATGCRLPA